MKSFKKRLERLAWDVSNIDNFNYAPQYGFNGRAIDKIIDDIVGDFPEVYLPGKGDNSTMLELKPDMVVDGVNIEILTKREREIKEIFKKLRKDKAYKRLLCAYKNDNQVEIADHLDCVFENLAITEIVGPGHDRVLYHGVNLRKGETSKDYLRRCLRIKDEGLKPSPYGLHRNMDHKIRPIYVTPDKYSTHGLIFFSFNPSQHALAVDKRGDEARIYSPNLKIDMSIGLRTEDSLASYSNNVSAETPNLKYEERCARELRDILSTEGVKFDELGIPKN